MKYLKLDNIIDGIIKNSNKIIEQISQEDIDVYCFIQDRFNNTKGNIKVDSIFKFLFKHYYFRNNFWVYSKSFFKAYFTIFSNNSLQERIKLENDINHVHNEILDFLYTHRKKLEFSYTTKMIHTVKPLYPIYDSNVVKALNLENFYRKERDKKNYYFSIYNEIRRIYNQIILNKSLKDVIEDFRKKRNISKLHEIKILDFIFWSAGKK